MGSTVTFFSPLCTKECSFLFPQLSTSTFKRTDSIEIYLQYTSPFFPFILEALCDCSSSFYPSTTFHFPPCFKQIPNVSLCEQSKGQYGILTPERGPFLHYNVSQLSGFVKPGPTEKAQRWWLVLAVEIQFLFGTGYRKQGAAVYALTHASAFVKCQQYSGRVQASLTVPEALNKNPFYFL